MMVVDIAPGPDRSGIASGTTAMLSLILASLASSGVCFSLLGVACIIEMAISRISIAPPTLNEAMVIPNNTRICWPITAARTRTTATEMLAMRAIWRFSASLLLAVMLTNNGTALMGFTITMSAMKNFA